MKCFERLAALVLTLALLAVTVFATSGASLAVSAVDGMKFAAYQVARLEDGALTALPGFEDLDLSGEDWQNLTAQVQSRITGEPAATIVADETGTARFALPEGLYFLTAQSLTRDGTVYSATPFLVLVQGNVSIQAKIQQSPQIREFDILIFWDDDCHSAQRPDQVTVTIRRDGEVYDTVTISKGDGWKYTFSGEAEHHWTVSQEPLAGCREPEYGGEGSTFTITNICSKTATPGNSTLPQTGQLWWPVPLLLCGGLLSILIGLYRRGGSRDEA